MRNHSTFEALESRLLLSGYFQQDSGSDGIVSMEAEHFDNNLSQGGKDWTGISYSGASGTAMQALPNTGSSVNTGYTTGSPRLDFEVNFVKTGTHYIWLLATGASSSDDSAHAGLDEQAIASADRIQTNSNGTLSWTKSTMDGVSASIDIATPGVYTLNVYMREDGVIVDKVVLTTNSSYTPSGAGPDESVRGGQVVVPAAPTGLAATAASSSQINLSWNDLSSNEDGFKIERKTGSGGTWSQIDTVNADVATYQDTNLSASTQYYYRVRAYNSAGDSAYSNEANATTQAAAGGSTVKVNFQTSDSAGYTGYLPDLGSSYADRGNGYSYGWSANNTSTARNRNSSNAPDERYDTLVHMQSGGTFTWEIGLANGTYEVHVACGDPAYTNQVNTISIEGTVANDADGEDNFDEYTVTVQVTDGKLTIAPATGAVNAKILFVDIAEQVSQDGAFQEVGGQVVMEAEHYHALAMNNDPVSNEWFVGTTALTGSVDSYMTTNTSGTNGSWTAGAEMSYQVQISTAGTYNLFVRRYAVDGTQNSVFGGADGTATSGYDNGSSGYGTWYWVNLGTMSLSSGEHTIQIRRREGGYNLDRIVLSTSSSTPTGTGPAESSRLGGTPSDTTAPATITSLATSSPTSSSVVLTWTAPGDDGSSGTASQYDIRYSTSQITSSNWASATQVSGEPSPASPGTQQQFTVTGLNANTTYYFAIKTADEVPNWAAVSNSPSATTPPFAITNILTNPGFETGDFSSWSKDPSGSTNITISNTAHTGNYSVQFLKDDLRQNFTTVTGRVYKVTVWLKVVNQASSSIPQFEIKARDQISSTIIAGRYNIDASDIGYDWQEIGFSFTATSTSTRLIMGVHNGTLGNLTILADDVMVFEKPTTNSLPTISVKSLTPTNITSLPATQNFSVTADDADGAVERVVWEFGDGARAYSFSGSRRVGVPGTYTATVYVVDDDNGITSQTISWTSTDSRFPSLTVNSTASQTSSNSINVSGTATSGSTITISTDRSQFVMASGSSSWSATVPLLPGNNKLVVQATDGEGDTRTIERVVRYVPSSALSISGMSESSTSIERWKELEVTFSLNNSAATHPQFPYTPTPARGMDWVDGTTVDAVFWRTRNPSVTYRRPAFLYQNYDRQNKSSREWLYPVGNPVWKVKFAPPDTGTWNYKIEVTEAKGSATSSTRSFSVTSATAGNHGFVVKSPDNRYFMWSDGTPFLGSGHAQDFDRATWTYDADNFFSAIGDGANQDSSAGGPAARCGALPGPSGRVRRSRTMATSPPPVSPSIMPTATAWPRCGSTRPIPWSNSASANTALA